MEGIEIAFASSPVLLQTSGIQDPARGEPDTCQLPCETSPPCCEVKPAPVVRIHQHFFCGINNFPRRSSTLAVRLGRGLAVGHFLCVVPRGEIGERRLKTVAGGGSHPPRCPGFHHQNVLKPARCQAVTAAGWKLIEVAPQSGHPSSHCRAGKLLALREAGRRVSVGP